MTSAAVVQPVVDVGNRSPCVQSNLAPNAAASSACLQKSYDYPRSKNSISGSWKQIFSKENIIEFFTEITLKGFWFFLFETY